MEDDKLLDKLLEKGNRKRCGVMTKNGHPCPGFQVHGASDGLCIFHSKDPKVHAILLEGRAKGNQMPTRRVRLSLRNTGIIFLRDIGGVVKYLNFLHREYFLRKITEDDVRVSLQIVGGLAKAFEIRDDTAEIEKLKDAIEQLSSGDILPDSDEVNVKITYDADGNGLEIPSSKED